MPPDPTSNELLDGLAVIDPQRYTDGRGYFFEAYNKASFAALTCFSGEFLQDNQSRSTRGVLRGLHYQTEPKAQGKLVRVVSGTVFDVAVDIRRESLSLGEWFGIELSAEAGIQLWIPPGFAHGFLTLSDTADVLYKTSETYSPEHGRTISWNDPSIGIQWPLDQVGTPIVSDGDAQGQGFSDADLLP